MSTLLCTDLQTELSRDIIFKDSGRIHIAAFYPYLLKVGNPSGTFTFSFLKGVEVLFSKTFIASEISSFAFAHSFFPIIPSSPIQVEAGTYYVKITTSGYTLNGDNYISWIQQYENVQNRIEYTAINDSENPLTIRIKIYKNGIE